MVTMKGKLITLEPLCIEKHARGYFEVSQDENIHRYTGNTVPKHIFVLSKEDHYFNQKENQLDVKRVHRTVGEQGKQHER